MNKSELKEFLDQKFIEYNTQAFISSDPIQLVHQFEKKEDREIVAFLISTIAWGNRTSIIKSGERLISLMGNNPLQFVLNYQELSQPFVHRTFNTEDLDFFFRSLKNIYENDGLESAFGSCPQNPGVLGRINTFREHFLSTLHAKRSEKHISNPLSNSACKRINMFLRWMVRKDKQGVDFGIWDSIPASELMIPLDVHTGNIARKLGLITRHQNDWKALEELMQTLREFDPYDPSKYDFALFGIGAFEKDF